MLSQERLREVLDYDPNTGNFTWRMRLNSRTIVGKIAGSHKDSGYVYIKIDGQDYLAHKLAWFYMYGEWVRLDHKDTIKGHNSLNNLRPATQKQNVKNSSIRYDNLLGVKGVYQIPSGNFCARIVIDGCFIHLGTFKTIEEAQNARREAVKIHFGEWANEEEMQLVD